MELAPKKASLAATRYRCFHLGKQVFDINQMVVEYFFGDIEQPENRRVSNRVVNVQSFLTANHDVAGAQDGELLGKGALLNFQKVAELVDSDLSVAESIQDRDPQWMRQCFEEFRLKPPKISHICIKSLLLYIVKHLN